MKIAPVLVFILLLSGCGTLITDTEQGAGSGQASYEIRRTADGECRVRVTSGRDVSKGRIMVDENCQLEAEASSMSGSEIQMRLIDRLMEKLQ